ncbi:PREDICTED: putative amidase C869.01-like [Fragaria vesca subsp. vesca]
MIISSSTAMAKPSFPHISSLLLLILLLTLSPLPGTLAAGKLSLKEATIDDIQHAFKHNQLTSRQLVQYYLVQIRKLNPVLKGVLEVNPDALHLADKADYERKTKAPVSLLSKLHGIPILVKDNIATKDKMNTTAGSLALLGSVVPRDASVVEKLRKAGAIILGKASLSEWSHFRGAAPSGWSARGGYGLNPYTFSDPCGSSSGSAISVAANLAMVSLGTETDGSILCPSGYNSVVGIKPTIGLTSRAGVVPISQRQDTVGPICRTVADAAYVLDAIAGIDHNDIATIETSKYIPKGGYAQFLRRDGLRGKRIGILRAFYDFGNDTSLAQTFEKHLTILRKAGAVLVDNLEVANWTAIYSSSDEINALSVECKISLNAYLKELVASPVRSLADVIAFNNKHQKLEKIKEYGQELFLAAEATNGFGKTEKAALLNLARWTRNGLVRLVTEKKLDAVVTPKAVFSSVLAIGGAPGLIVPAGYENNGRPAGICFGGLRGSEPKLIEIAYAFEQATKIRKPPSFNGLKF